MRSSFPVGRPAGNDGVPCGAGSVLEFEAQMRDLDVDANFPPLRDYVLSMAEKGNGRLIWLT